MYVIKDAAGADGLRLPRRDCPCRDDKPDPCPVCGASVARGICKVEMFTEATTNAVMLAIAETEGEPLGLRAATVIAAVRDHL